MAQSFARPFYKSKAWQETRAYILKRDAYICQVCGKAGEEVHHIIHLTKDNINDVSITLNPNNLILLCKDCHHNEHIKDKSRGHIKDNGRFEVADNLDKNYMFDENGQFVKRVDLHFNPPTQKK